MQDITRDELVALLENESIVLVEALWEMHYNSGPSCTRSKVAAVAFEKLGYTDVRVYSGGEADWYEAGLTLTVGVSTAA
jgi:3-mercaptopyruvate sulfurtransferase SseA